MYEEKIFDFYQRYTDNWSKMDKYGFLYLIEHGMQMLELEDSDIDEQSVLSIINKSYLDAKINVTLNLFSLINDLRYGLNLSKKLNNFCLFAISCG